MALADSVPGVSGGTIAFILGFYDDFINSINSLMSKNSLKEKSVALRFLGKIGLGWIIGAVISIFFLTSLFEKHIYSVSSLFVGFILLSIPVIIHEEKEVITGKYRHLICTLTGILIVVALTVLNPYASGGGVSLGLDNMSLGLAVYVFLAGMIAISAMVLPGISGSTILLIFGLYTAIISAIKEVMLFNLEYLPIVMIFALGIMTGFATSVRLIRWVLKKHRAQAIYTVLGLMLGSLYAVFMGPTTLPVPHEAMNLGNFDFIFFFIGALLIFVLDRIKIYFKK
ncbi:MAG: DUF368 domain-containing protein [Fusobacteria bacterium]|nr:DUF368 domain-containing protein [Fusobacteriota bacterium]